MKQLRQFARQVSIVPTISKEPLFVPPGHFYSPLSNSDDAARARVQRVDMALDEGIDIREDGQLRMTERLGPEWLNFRSSWRRYASNEMYGISDGAVYFSILKTLRPRRVIEVGSGFTSAIALDVRDRYLPELNLTFIEPYTDRLVSLLSESDHRSIELHRDRVQDVPIESFDVLEEGDILFIDSTHVSKAGSDVNWLYFRVLPRLKPGVIVHIHDIFYPFEYVDAWLAERRSWNEAYLLRAFLTFNNAYRIELFNSWLWQKRPDIIRRYLPANEHDRPGSIWLRRVAF